MFRQQLRYDLRQFIANLSGLPTLPKVDNGFLLECVLSDKYKRDIEPLINSIDLQLMLEDKRDDAANDGYTDHPHRMDKPHPADA